MALEVVQGAALDVQRGDHGQVGGLEFGGESVFFGDGFVGPAAGPVELGHQRRAFFHADAVDAVFVAVERQYASIAEETDAFDSIEYQVGCQLFQIFHLFVNVNC